MICVWYVGVLFVVMFGGIIGGGFVFFVFVFLYKVYVFIILLVLYMSVGLVVILVVFFVVKEIVYKLFDE